LRPQGLAVVELASLPRDLPSGLSRCRQIRRRNARADHCAGTAAHQLCVAQGMSESQILNANPRCNDLGSDFHNQLK